MNSTSNGRPPFLSVSRLLVFPVFFHFISVRWDGMLNKRLWSADLGVWVLY